MAFAYAVFAQFLSLEVAASLEKKNKHLQFAAEHGPVEILDFPIKNGDVPYKVVPHS